MLADLFRERGVRLDRTYQLNFGGNADSMNMLDRDRLELLRLHRDRWATRSLRGALAAEGVEGFLREACPLMAAADMLRLHLLRLDGRTVGAMLVLWHPEPSRKRAYVFIGGFEPSLNGLSPPGTLLIGHAIEEATREHGETFDFLRGAERYKCLWGAVDTATFRQALRRAPADAPGRPARPSVCMACEDG